MASRLEALHNSDGDYLAAAWQRGDPLYKAWLIRWQQQWPASRRFAAGLAHLGRLLRQYLQQSGGVPAGAGGLPRQQLVAEALSNPRSSGGRLTLLATDGAGRFARVGGRFLGDELSPQDITLVDL